MSSELEQTLISCSSPDLATRQAAEQKLAQAEQGNLSGFMLALVTELGTETKSLQPRQLAGIHLKNLISAKDSNIYTTKVARWLALPGPEKDQIKNNLIQILLSEQLIARHTAGQVVAEIGAIDLPSNQWPSLMQTLLLNVTGQSADGVKITTLECLGYMCERMEAVGSSLEQTATNQILTAIVDGIKENRPAEIRFAAATALRHSLLFCRTNMETAAERNMIMQVICEATRCENEKVRVASYECIVQMAEHYYEHLDDYMKVLFQLTFNTIKTDVDVVATQAIEFWSTLCDVEVDIMDEHADLQERGQQPEQPRKDYVRAALEYLVPLLLETLTKQDESADPDEETWNMCMAGGSCLQLVSNCVEDAVVDFVMPFVQGSINSENWRFREAAIMAFSMILDGPSTEKIGPFVNQSIPVLINLLRDPHTLVKDTTAWTLGRICEIHARCVPPQIFPQLVEGLMAVLMTESPRVSSRSCFALHNLAMAFEGEDDATNGLSGYMKNLLGTLLQVTERPDWDESNLRSDAYQAINMLIQHAAQDCNALLKELLPVIIGRLQASFTMPVVSNDDRDAKMGLQSLLCGTLQVITQQLEKPDLAPFADQIMTNILKVFENRNATADEEALYAVGALADKLEKDFNRYMPAFINCVMAGLRNHEAYQVCIVAVGVVGDLCRALEGEIQPYCNDLCTALLENLRNPELNREVKPCVLGCFGDVALAIEGNFLPYLEVTLQMLLQASQTMAPEDDEDLIEYVNRLREGILEAYTGIVQGLKEGNEEGKIVGYTEAIMAFLEVLTNDINKDEGIVRGAVGCLGDLASALGSRVPGIKSKPFVNRLLQEGQNSEDLKVVETATWATSVIAKLSY